MKIEYVMESRDRLMTAYTQYKRELKRKPASQDEDALLSQIGRMFMVPDLKRFKEFVMAQQDTNVMESQELLMTAYTQYKRELRRKPASQSEDALISQIGRMFMVPNLKRFREFVLAQQDD